LRDASKVEDDVVEPTGCSPFQEVLFEGAIEALDLHSSVDDAASGAAEASPAAEAVNAETALVLRRRHPLLLQVQSTSLSSNPVSSNIRLARIFLVTLYTE